MARLVCIRESSVPRRSGRALAVVLMSVRRQYLFKVAGVITVGFCLVILMGRRSVQLGTGLVVVGPPSENGSICFGASVTNLSDSSLLLQGVRYEWRVRTGQIHGADAFSGWNHAFAPGAMETTTFLIPHDAQSVRVSIIYDLRPRIGPACLKLATQPLVARFHRLQAWLLDLGCQAPAHHCFYSSWTANETGCSEPRDYVSVPIQASGARGR